MQYSRLRLSAQLLEIFYGKLKILLVINQYVWTSIIPDWIEDMARIEGTS